METEQKEESKLSQITRHQGQAIQKVKAEIVPQINQGAQSFLAEWRSQQTRLANVENAQQKTLSAVQELASQVEKIQLNQQRTIDTVDRMNLQINVVMNKADKPVVVSDPNLQPLMYGFYITVGLVVIAFLATVLDTSLARMKHNQQYQSQEVHHVQNS